MTVAKQELPGAGNLPFFWSLFIVAHQKEPVVEVVDQCEGVWDVVALGAKHQHHCQAQLFVTPFCEEPLGDASSGDGEAWLCAGVHQAREGRHLLHLHPAQLRQGGT